MDLPRAGGDGGSRVRLVYHAPLIEPLSQGNMKEVVLITGASSGFGEACARRFASEGHALVLAARSLDRLQALADELSNAAAIHCARLDVREQAAVESFVQELPDAFRDIGILVNNAGLALGAGPAQEADPEDWNRMIETNVTGLVHLTRVVLQGMVARDHGHVVNIGSMAGSWPYPGGNVYGATKAFVAQFSRGLRADLLGRRIRVTNVEPGLAETNFSVVRFKGDREKARKVYEGTQPLTAGDIADIVHWVTAAPPHVNINAVEVMPTCQAWGPLPVDRGMSDD